MRYYAGIGSRDTPKDILEVMQHVADKLGSEGYILRSGGAEGADTAFEKGANGYSKQIFLPWKGFNNSDSPYYEYQQVHHDLAEQYHPSLYALSKGSQKMMVRNSAQIVGRTGQEDVEFVICWTKMGKFVGGTGQALRIAYSKDIPIFNLAFDDVMEVVGIYCVDPDYTFDQLRKDIGG
jgi:hypothetical protein